MIDTITVLAQIESVSGNSTASAPSPGGIVVVGFLFVIVVLALLATITSVMGVWFAKQAASDAAKAAIAAQAAAEASQKPAFADSKASFSNQEEDSVIMAVVAAAVHSVIGDQPHRVVSIRSAGPGWAQEGRRQIFSSHRVR